MGARVDPTDYEGVEANRAELARVLGVSAPTLDRYIADGLPVLEAGSNGQAYRFDVGQALRWVDEKKRLLADREAERQQRLADLQASFDLDEGAGDQAGSGLNYRQQAEYLDAQIKFNRVARERGELRRATEVTATLESLCRAIADGLQSLPDRLERELSLDAETVDAIERETSRFQANMARDVEEAMALLAQASEAGRADDERAA